MDAISAIVWIGVIVSLAGIVLMGLDPLLGFALAFSGIGMAMAAIGAGIESTWARAKDLATRVMMPEPLSKSSGDEGVAKKVKKIAASG